MSFLVSSCTEAPGFASSKLVKPETTLRHVRHEHNEPVAPCCHSFFTGFNTFSTCFNRFQ